MSKLSTGVLQLVGWAISFIQLQSCISDDFPHIA